MTSSLRSLLVNSSVHDLVSMREAAIGGQRHVLTMKDDATVDAALHALSKAKVLSAPMISAEGDPIGG